MVRLHGVTCDMSVTVGSIVFVGQVTIISLFAILKIIHMYFGITRDFLNRLRVRVVSAWVVSANF